MKTSTAPAELRSALQWGYRDAVQEYGNLLASLGLSILEVTYQGHDKATRICWRDARLALLEANDILKKLEALDEADGNTA
jgi:hypothetical protein